MTCGLAGAPAPVRTERSRPSRRPGPRESGGKRMQVCDRGRAPMCEIVPPPRLSSGEETRLRGWAGDKRLAAPEASWTRRPSAATSLSVALPSLLGSCVRKAQAQSGDWQVRMGVSGEPLPL